MKSQAIQLSGAHCVDWKDELPSGRTVREILFGKDHICAGQVQVGVATAAARPTNTHSDAAWHTRNAKNTTPVVVVNTGDVRMHGTSRAVDAAIEGDARQ